ncbi:MAG TPA: Ni/Fe hydrogenase subunit alpha [Bacteroidota bacterium]
MNSRVIKVEELARVEGEGGIQVKISDGRVTDVRLRIPEPPRFFEALLRGRKFSEVPDITARICGICPVAYQMSAVHAVEDAFHFELDGRLRSLRRLLYCGEWIESHILHAAMLHAPDFLGLDDALALARENPALVRSALSMKRTGNDLVTVIGGREIHPVNVRVGGFYQLPSVRLLQGLLDPLRRGRDGVREFARVVAQFDIPEFEAEYEFVALHHPNEYALCEGKLLTSSGQEIAPREYEFHFEERHVHHSHALHSYEKGHGSYCVGPLARFNLNFDTLPPAAKELAAELKLAPPVRNPFKSILVRLVEALFAFDEAVRLIEGYEPPDRPCGAIVPHAGIGFAITEAPRGLLYHRYRFDEEGMVRDAKIVPPTAQNQPTIEQDLRRFVDAHPEMPRDQLTWRCEQVVRNYDPCISCATHALKVRLTE